jgi:hypothetical protein
METFPLETQVGLPPEALASSNLDRLETHEQRLTTYALVVLSAASVRLAATALDRDEFDTLVEIARGVGVEI